MSKKISATIILFVITIILLVLCICTILFDKKEENSDTDYVSVQGMLKDRTPLRSPLGGERYLDYNSDDYAKTIMYAQLYMSEEYVKSNFPEVFEDTDPEEYTEREHDHISTDESQYSQLENYFSENNLTAGNVNVITYNMYENKNTGRPEILFYNPYKEQTLPLYYVNLQDTEYNQNYDIWCFRGISTDEFCQMLCELTMQGYVPYEVESGSICTYESAETVKEIIAKSVDDTVIFGFTTQDENNVIATITFTYYKDCILYDWMNGDIEPLNESECCFAASIIYPLDYVLGY